MRDLIKKLKSEVRRRFRDAPGCHDWDHTSRVLLNALTIAKAEAELRMVDVDVVEAAAILHDVARVEEISGKGSMCHAIKGAEIAHDILISLGCKDRRFAARVCECVRRHRFRGRTEAPETIEQKIVYDADKLDQIGAVGVSRAIHFSGRIGSVLHNTPKQALASKAYSKGDSAYREYLVKLRHIPAKMLTGTGRKMAAERASYMHAFFQQLNAEYKGRI